MIGLLTGPGAAAAVLLSIDIKTKVFQHVPRINFNVFKVFRFPAPV